MSKDLTSFKILQSAKGPVEGQSAKIMITFLQLYLVHLVSFLGINKLFTPNLLRVIFWITVAIQIKIIDPVHN